jgi:hypothetical protein
MELLYLYVYFTWGLLPQGIKQPTNKAAQTHSFSTEFKNMCITTFSPYGTTPYHLIKQKKKLKYPLISALKLDKNSAFWPQMYPIVCGVSFDAFCQVAPCSLKKAYSSLSPP